MRPLTVSFLASLLLLGCNPNKPRPPVDCEAFVYDRGDFEAKVTTSKFGAIEVGTTHKAIREVDQAVERFMGRWGTLCREYNAGLVDKTSYQQQAQAMRAKMEQLDELQLELDRAPDAASFQAVLRSGYGEWVSEQSVDLQVELAVWAQRPGEASFAVVAPGAALPTGTKVRLEITTNRAAYLYVYQVEPTGGVNVLFPFDKIPYRNPIDGGTALTFPPAPASFTLDDEDLGTEHVHVVASTRPMDELGTSLGRAVEDPSSVAASELDCEGARGLVYDPGDCPDTRGLVYDAGDEGGYSTRVQNAAADDSVHLVFELDHTAP